MRTRMLRAQFRIQLPEDTWVSQISQLHPQATFRLLSGIQTGDTAVELGEVLTDSPATVSQAISDHDAISNYEELARTGRKVLGKYETVDTGLYAFAEGLTLPPEFPIAVTDG